MCKYELSKSTVFSFIFMPLYLLFPLPRLLLLQPCLPNHAHASSKVSSQVTASGRPQLITPMKMVSDGHQRFVIIFLLGKFHHPLEIKCSSMTCFGQWNMRRNYTHFPGRSVKSQDVSFHTHFLPLWWLWAGVNLSLHQSDRLQNAGLLLTTSDMKHE